MGRPRGWIGALLPPAAACFALAWPWSPASGPAGARPPVAGMGACALESVGVDTSLADRNSYVAALDGEAPGETFLAVDTLIRSIVVWRAAVEANDTAPMKLWITEVDSSGVPLTDHVLLDGPWISYPFGDGIHPTKIQYLFDPPFALPRRGTFYFAIQELCYGYFDLLVSHSDPYAQGSAWRSGRSFLSGCGLRPYPNRLLHPDLVFTIDFCRDTTTAVRRTSWGRLKAIYR